MHLKLKKKTYKNEQIFFFKILYLSLKSLLFHTTYKDLNDTTC